MLHSITVAKSHIIFSTVMLVFLMSSSIVQSKSIVKSTSQRLQVENPTSFNADRSPRQFLFLTGVGRETSTPDFIRLVVMRFIYGLASTMGVEERLEGLFNGAFVPPNADNDLFSFGGLGGDGGSDGGEFDAAVFEGLFDDDAF